jgi:hypothetical protein
MDFELQSERQTILNKYPNFVIIAKSLNIVITFPSAFSQTLHENTDV